MTKDKAQARRTHDNVTKNRMTEAKRHKPDGQRPTVERAAVRRIKANG